MPIVLEIPDSVAAALRLPPRETEQRLKVELAAGLHPRQILGLGKASELAEMSRDRFGLWLGEPGIPRRYGIEEMTEDLAYGHR